MGVYTVFMLCRVVESRNPGYPVGSEWVFILCRVFILCLCCVFMLCRVVESRNPEYPVGSEWVFILCLCRVGWWRAGTQGTL